MKKKIIVAIAALTSCMGAWGQSLVNPAENAFLDNGFVRIGEFTSNSRNNVGAAAFLFPVGDQVVTGLHSSISTDHFLSGLEPVNSMFSQIEFSPTLTKIFTTRLAMSTLGTVILCL